jgi:hypothetical protein
MRIRTMHDGGPSDGPWLLLQTSKRGQVDRRLIVAFESDRREWAKSIRNVCGTRAMPSSPTIDRVGRRRVTILKERNTWTT